ncbi:MAG: transcription antitermination factor NusB [Paludibacteraceae bacterium]
MAEKELDKSIEQAHDLYLFMLSLIPTLTHYVELELDNRRNKYIPTDADLNPNTRFADNILAKQMAESHVLADFATRVSYSWHDDETFLKNFFEHIATTPHYQTYMSADVRSYEADKEIWRKIFKVDIPACEAIDNLLEEISVYWNDDLETVSSFVQKTIKRCTVDSNVDDEILPLYHSDDDDEFVHQLFAAVIDNSAKYDKLIDETTKNWELDRIAFMDILIMKVALAELFTFPTIPVSVTLNEYIEIAKAYSTPRSAPFINGVLDKIVGNLKRQGVLVKPETI